MEFYVRKKYLILLGKQVLKLENTWIKYLLWQLTFSFRVISDLIPGL